jgi:hypothetical protein
MTIDSVMIRLARHMAGNMGQAMKVAEGHARTSFTQAKTGREYRRSSGEKYTASAVGEPPAIKDGALNNSLRTRVMIRPDGVIGELSANTPYALSLETGIGHATGAKRRPFLRPAVRNNFQRIGAILARP